MKFHRLEVQKLQTFWCCYASRWRRARYA